jgi:hypothetical protein
LYVCRYYMFDLAYSISVYDSGEEDAAPDISLLLEADGTQSAVMQTAAKYHGIGVVWEHRYYGQSLPFVTGNVSLGLCWLYPQSELDAELTSGARLHGRPVAVPHSGPGMLATFSLREAWLSKL